MAHVGEFNGGDYEKDALLTFLVGPRGLLSQAAHFRVIIPNLVAFTESRSEIYVSTIDYSRAAYAIRADGSPNLLWSVPSDLPNAPSIPSINTPSDSPAADFIRIYPLAVPSPMPGITVTSWAVDQSKNLLFGFGGDNNNEIDVWKTPTTWSEQPIERYWFDEHGFFPYTDGRARRATPNVLCPDPPALTAVDPSGKFLYLERRTPTTFTGTPSSTNELFCFQTFPNGTLTLKSSNSCKGFDLRKEVIYSFSP